MIEFNKTTFVKFISDYIIENVALHRKFHYNLVKSYVTENSSAVSFISRKKNAAIYLDHILKYDKQLKEVLSKHTISLNKEMQYCVRLGQTKEPTEVLFYDEDKLSDLFCPYMTLMLSQKQQSRVSFKNNKTNERIINYELIGNDNVNQLITFIDSIIDNCTFAYKNNIYILNINGIKSYLKLNDTSIELKLESELHKLSSKVKSIYPFNYYVYFHIILFTYILNRLGRVSEAKYIVIKLFDITVNQYTNKYFLESNGESPLIINNLYDIFFKDKIQDMIYKDYIFISDFFAIYNENEKRNLINYVVGHYKLYIYLKNKYNREIKNAAIELYETNKRSAVNEIINFADATSLNATLFKQDIISKKDLLEV